MPFLFALLLMAAAPSPLDQTKPEAVVKAAEQYLAALRDTCPDDAACMQKFRFENAEELNNALIGEPWAAFVLTYDEIREAEFQDLLKIARFNYFASPIVTNGQYKGIVRVCEDTGDPGVQWTSCGSRGPTRLAEVNTYGLTQAPQGDSLSVVCVLTVQNNARYILVKKGTEYFAIAGSDQAAELINSMTWHVSRMTMFPLSEALYKLNVNVKQMNLKPRS